MKHTHTAARAAVVPQNLLLPIEAPRESWPCLLDHAAAALSGECVFDSETLVRVLRAIAVVLRADCYDDLCEALRDCIEADQPMAEMHATERARSVLRHLRRAEVQA